ncbi:MAG: transposase [Hyphomicrobiales bacterium]|jgi:transposase|nr:MAG: transposase [Hyphomicrobiales bacterium]
MTEAGVDDKILTDELWTAVAPLLPGKEGDPGCHGRDNRLFLEGVFWVARTGSPWRGLPPEFGKWYTTYTRYHRWEKKGVWPKVVEALQRQGAAGLRYDEAGLRWAELAPAIECEAGPDRVAA